MSDEQRAATHAISNPLYESQLILLYTARPLKRAIQQHVQDPLALALLEGKFQRGDTVVADVENGRPMFDKEVVGEVV